MRFVFDTNVLIDYLGYGDNSEIAADALAAAVGRGQVFISIASIMELWLPLREGDATGPGEKGSKRMIGKNQIRKEVRDILRLCERLGIKIIYCTPRAQEKALDILKVPRYRSYLGQSTNAIIDSLIIASGILRRAYLVSKDLKWKEIYNRVLTPEKVREMYG